MRKLIIVMVVALLALALVACGGETATTTEGATTTKAPTTTVPGAVTTTPGADTTVPGVVTTTPATSTQAPATTTTPATTEPVPPVEAEINKYMETAWWNEVHRMNQIQYVKNADESKSYIWSLTIKAESGLFQTLPEDHETYPAMPGIQLTNSDGAFVYIKDINKDADYTKYPIKAGSWRTERWCDIWFEAEGFIPAADGQYDMFLTFNLPNVEGATPYPGEPIYVWALGEVWTYNAPLVIGDPIVDDAIKDAYKCNLHRHNEKYLVDHTTGFANGTPPENFPTNTFNFTVKAEDGLFPHLEGGLESFQEIIPEGAFAYVKGPDDTEFTRYECDYMLTERWCDMWFTLKDFTPVAGAQYEMAFCFMSGVGATNPYTLHYVYATDWVAGAPVGQ